MSPDAAAGGTAAEELVSTVRALWPDSEVRLGRHRRQAPASCTAQFAVVPHARAPRLLIPSEQPVASTSLRRFSTAVSARGSMERLTAALLTRATRGALLADRIIVTGGTSRSLAAHLGEIFEGPVTFSLGIGTARVNRKPVLQVFGADGRTLAFAKLAASERARTALATEAACLDRLAERTWTHLAPPRLLHRTEWNGMQVLLLSPLPTTPFRRPRDRWRPPDEAMAELAGAFPGAGGTLGELPWLEARRWVADGLRDRRSGELLSRCIDELVDLAAGRTWAVGAWHGDWTAWNMCRSGGVVQLWDWERFQTDVPAGLDRFHYLVNAATSRQGLSPASIRFGLDSAAGRNGLREIGSPFHVLAGCYLVAVATRYLTLGEGEGGGVITERAQCTLSALADLVGRSG